MILIKLGGSVITDKTKYRSIDIKTIKRLCREIKKSKEEVVIVHGAGSFGHILAKEYKISEGFKDDSQIKAVAQICQDVRYLNSVIIRELNNAGVPAISIPTGSCFRMKNKELIIDDDYVMSNWSDLGIVPVTFGDVVLDSELGFAICSGDQIIERLADLCKPSRIIFVSDVDGLYDKNPRTNPDAKLIPVVNKKLLDEAVDTNMFVADVTGGIREKMEAALRLCKGGREVYVVNGMVEGRLLSLLKGEDVICTKGEGDD